MLSNMQCRGKEGNNVMSATRPMFGHLDGEPQSYRSAFKVLRVIKQPNKMCREQISSILTHQMGDTVIAVQVFKGGGNSKDRRPKTLNIKCVGSIFLHC